MNKKTVLIFGAGASYDCFPGSRNIFPKMNELFNISVEEAEQDEIELKSK